MASIPNNTSAPGRWKLRDVRDANMDSSWPQVRDTYFNHNTLLLSTNNINDANNNYFADSSSYRHPITGTGNVTQGSFSPYGDGWSCYFDGDGDYLSIADNAAFEFGTDDFTIEFWANFVAVGGTAHAIVVKGYPSWSPWQIYIDGAGKVLLYSTSNGASWDIAEAVNIVTPIIGQWYHIAITRFGTTFRTFANGIQASTFTSSLSLLNNTSPVTVAGGVSGQASVKCYISNLRLIKGTALYTANFTPSTSPLTATSSTVLLTCNANSFKDSSTNNFDITKYGDTLVTPYSPFSPKEPYGVNGYSSKHGSVYFDGNGDYLDADLLDNSYLLGPQGSAKSYLFPTDANLSAGTTEDYTFEFWGKRTSISTFNTAFSTPTAGKVILRISGGAWNSSVGPVIAQTTLDANVVAGVGVWFHYAISRQNGTTYVHINGVQYGSTTTSYNFTMSGGSNRIGNYNNNSSQEWVGYLSNIRYVKGYAVYALDSTFTPSTVPLQSIPGTVALLAQKSILVDRGPLNLNITGTASIATDITPFTSTSTDISNFSIGTNNFTVEAWVFAPSTAANYAQLCGQRDSSGNVNNNSPFGLFKNNTGPELNFSYFNGSSNLSGNPTIAVFDNRWHHIALVRNNTDLRLYVDGISSTYLTIPEGFSFPESTTSFSIGRAGEYAGQYWTGFISNFRFVKGTAVYTSEFIPSKAPLVATQDTILLTCQNSFSDSSTNNFILGVNGNASLTHSDPFDYSDYKIANPVGSYYFDGTGDYLTLPNSSNFAISANQDFTIETWVYLTTTRNDYSYIFYTYDGSNILQFRIGNSGFGYRIQATFGPSASADSVFDNTSYTQTTILGQWTHLALSRSGDSTTFFVNGKVAQTKTGTASRAIASPSGGAYLSYLDPYGFPGGYISNFRFTKNTALYTANFTPPAAQLESTSDTVLLLKGDAAGIYDSTGNNTLEIVGNAVVSTTQSIWGTSSVYFDGAGAYLTLRGDTLNWIHQGNTDFTLECWIYTTNAALQQAIASTTGSSAQVGFYWDIYQNNVRFIFNRGSSGNSYIFVSSNTVTSNTWNHIAVTFNSTTKLVDIFINGVLSPVTITGTASFSTAAATYSPDIGSFNTTTVGRGGYFNGYIQDLRITRGIARYTTNFGPVLPKMKENVPGTVLLLKPTSSQNWLVDNSEFNHTVTAVGNAIYSSFAPPGGVGSFLFDGSGDELTIPYNSNFSFGTNDFTVECWFNLTADAPLDGASIRPAHLIGPGQVVDNISWYLSLLGSSTTTGTGILFQRRDTSGNFTSFTTTYTFQKNTWYHVAVSKIGTVISMFINGVKVGEDSSWNFTVNANSVFRIGRRAVGTSYEHYFPGYISNIRVINGSGIYTTNFALKATPRLPLY